MSPASPACEPIRVAWAWRSMGPYHLARMRALAARPEIELTVVERYGSDPERAWRIDRRALAGNERGDGAAVPAPGRGLRVLDWGEALAGLEDPASPVARAEIVVLPGWAERDFLRWASALPRRVRRCVWNVSTARDRPRVWWRELLKRLRVAGFDHGLAAGARARDYLLALGMKPGRLAAIGNAADPAPYRAARAAQGFPASPPYAIYSGRLAPEKNLRELLAAWRDAGRSADGPIDLMLAGAGVDRAPLEAEAASALPGRVRFLGETPPEQLAPLVAGAAFLVLPSRVEPWGLVVNEALHAGRPVVLTDACGCVPELGQGDHAWVAPTGDRADLAQALAAAGEAAATWDARGARGAAVADRFDPEACAARAADALVGWLR